MSTYFKLGSIVEGITTVATAESTTSLVASSRQHQVFTGTLGQIVVLPDATTVSIARRFDIYNSSTGVLTIQNAGGNTLTTIAANSQKYFISTDTSSPSGNWVVGGIQGGGSNTSSLSVADRLTVLSGAAGMQFEGETIVSQPVKFNPENSSDLGVWRSRAGLAVARQAGAGFARGGHTFLAGGWTDSGNILYNNVSRFNDDTSNYFERANLTTSRMLASGFNDDTYGYVVGGCLSPSTINAPVNTHERYNDITNAWSSRTNLPVARCLMSKAMYNGLAYLMAGYGAAGIQNKIESYNPVNDSWTAYDTTFNSREEGGVAELSDSAVLFGGDDGNALIDTVQTYLYMYGYRRSEPVLAQACSRQFSFTMNDVAFFGGGTSSVAQEFKAFSYDKESRSVKRILDCPNATNRSGFAVLNGAGIVMGGYQTSGTLSSTTPVFSPFVYANLGLMKKSAKDPSSILTAIKALGYTLNVPVQVRTDGHTWKNLMSGRDVTLKQGETSLANKFLRSGNLHIAGGGVTGTGAVATSERYSPLTNTWIARSNMGTTRGAQYMRLAQDGYGMIGGGTNGTKEEYNEDTNLFTASSGDHPSGSLVTSGNFRLGGATFITGGYTQLPTVYVNTTYSYVRVTNTFTARAAFASTARGNLSSSFTLRDKGYIAGGFNGSGQNACDSYDAVLNTWTSIPTYNAAQIRGGASMANESAGYGFIGSGYNVNGGVVNDNGWFYSADLRAWNTVATNATPFVYDCYGDTIAGISYIVNGATSGNTSNQLTAYGFESRFPITRANSNSGREWAAPIGSGFYRNYEVRVGVPAKLIGLGSGVWVTRSEGIQERHNIGAEYVEGCFYVMGGNNPSGGHNTVQFYEPTKDTWTSSFPLGGSSRLSPGNFVLNGQWYAVAGLLGDLSTLLSSVECFDPVAKVYTNKASLGNTSYPNTGAAFNGFGYRLLGRTNTSNYVTSSERYNDVTNAWTGVASVASTARAFTTAFLGSGMLYICAGVDNSNTYNLVDAYNDASNTWITRNGTISARQAMTGGTLDSRGMICSGYNGSVMSTCEYNNPDGNFWYQAPQVITSTYSANMNGSLGDSLIKTHGLVSGGAESKAVEIFMPSVKNAILGLALEVK